MRLAAFASFDPEDRYLRFIKQYGVNELIVGGKADPDVLGRAPIEASDSPDSHWTFMDLVNLRTRCEALGLRVAALENPLPPWCYDRAMLGLPGRDQQIDNLAKTIRNMGRAGIPILGYHWMVNPAGVTRASWRTSLRAPARGGASASQLDMELAARAPQSRDRVYSADEMWSNWTYFIRALAPVAEEAGVKLALHPDDPPVASLGGVARIFNSFASFERAMEVAASPACGLEFCLGNWWAMGTDVIAAIRRFGPRGQIHYVHVQGVHGTVPRFQECFLDEADCDFPAVLRALRDVGFDGVLAPAHVPDTIDDTPRQHQGHAFAFGYLRGLLQAL